MPDGLKVDTAPPSGADIHAPVGEADLASLWGDDDSSGGQSTTIAQEPTQGAATQPSSSAPAAPKPPAGDYDFDDPSFTEPAPEPTAQDDAEPDDGVQVLGAGGRPVNQPLSNDLVMRAGRLGWDAADLAAFQQNSAGLEAAIRRDETRITRENQQRQQQQPAPNPFLAYANPQNLTAALQKAITGAGPNVKFDRKVMEAQGFEAAAIDAMETAVNNGVAQNSQQFAAAIAQQLAPTFHYMAGMHQWAMGAEQRHQTLVQQTQQAEAQRGVESWNREFEGHIKALPDAWRKIAEVPENRDAIHLQVGVLAESYQRLGQKIPTGKELVKQALQMKFGNRTEAVVREQVRKDVDRRNQRGIARAKPSGGRAPSGEGGDDAAIKHLMTWGFK